MRTFRARLTDVRRMPSSVNGNPRWSLQLDDKFRVRTGPDSSCGYDVPNLKVGQTYQFKVSGGSIVGIDK